MMLHTTDESIIWSLRVHRHKNKSFGNFCAVTQSTIIKLQAATVNNRRHAPGIDSHHGNDIAMNMALVISVLDLYKRCLSEAKHQKIQDERTPSQSLFRFQF